MAIVQQYHVKKNDFSDIVPLSFPLPPPAVGEALIKITRIAFTANNISYALAGESLGYWRFFPPASNQNSHGIVPVWGYGQVEAEQDSGLAVGESVFGYWPMASHCLVAPAAVAAHRFTDGAAHRRDLPMIYNQYRRVTAAEYADQNFCDRQSLLYPLVGTAFGIYDWLDQGGREDATQLVLTSASSKTAIGLAHLVKNNSDLQLIGLTSKRNIEATAQLGLYHEIIAYDDLANIKKTPTLIVDMAGDGSVSANLHQHLGDALRREARVGATHLEQQFKPEGINKERSFFFFLPTHAAKRQKESEGRFLKDMMAFNRQFAIESVHWLNLVVATTQEEVLDLYHRVRQGKLLANEGAILSLEANDDNASP